VKKRYEENKKNYGDNEKIYGDKDWKCIKTNNNYVSDLRKVSSSNFPVFYIAIEKVMKLYEEERNDWGIRRLVCFPFFYILLHIHT